MTEQQDDQPAPNPVDILDHAVFAVFSGWADFREAMLETLRGGRWFRAPSEEICAKAKAAKKRIREAAPIAQEAYREFEEVTPILGAGVTTFGGVTGTSAIESVIKFGCFLADGWKDDPDDKPLPSRWKTFWISWRSVGDRVLGTDNISETAARIQIEMARLRAGLAMEAEAAKASPIGELSDTEQRIVDAIREHGPTQGRDLARRIHRSYTGSFRSELAALARRGILRKTPDGYAVD